MEQVNSGIDSARNKVYSDAVAVNNAAANNANSVGTPRGAGAAVPVKSHGTAGGSSGGVAATTISTGAAIFSSNAIHSSSASHSQVVVGAGNSLNSASNSSSVNEKTVTANVNSVQSNNSNSNTANTASVSLVSVLNQASQIFGRAEGERRNAHFSGKRGDADNALKSFREGLRVLAIIVDNNVGAKNN